MQVNVSKVFFLGNRTYSIYLRNNCFLIYPYTFISNPPGAPKLKQGNGDFIGEDVAYFLKELEATGLVRKIEFESAYATASAGRFIISLLIKNSGTATATIESIFVNGIPLNDVDAFSSLTLSTTTYTSVNISDLSYPLAPGNEVEGTITLTRNRNIDSGTVTSGMTIEIMIQTAASSQYPKSVTLP